LCNFAAMPRHNAILTILLMLPIAAWAQEVLPDSSSQSAPVMSPRVKLSRTLWQGDSIQYVELNRIYVYPEQHFKNEKARRQYNRLVANVKEVLPLAKKVNGIIIETYEYLQTLDTEKERQEHMKLVEKDLKRQYYPVMKKLTYQQGKLLIRLIYRETHSSSYQLINAFLGPIRAGFYQAFASLFGASLTKKYDPDGADRMTERVVRQVEAGQI